jgi:hypothetical protein
MTCVKRIAGAAAIGAAMLMVLSVPPAQAGYVVTLTQEVIGGVNDVVANGTGALDLTGLHLTPASFSDSAFIHSIVPVIITGPTTPGLMDDYELITTGTGIWGPGGPSVDASSGSGDLVGVDIHDGDLLVPAGYTSGNLSDMSTYDNQTFASLGVTPGTYEYTWGTGANQNFTLQIGPTAAVPEPSTWAMMLVGFAGLGFFGYRASRKGAALAA